MAEIDVVISGVCAALKAAGVPAAVTSFPFGGKKRHTKPIAAVSVKSGSAISSGFAEYLGEYLDVETGGYYELYGKRLELTVGIGIYSPPDEQHGAIACPKLFSDIAAAVTRLPAGLRVKEISCTETRFDEDVGLFLCEAELSCAAHLYARAEEEGEFLDFRLKGEVVN